ncbi:MAG TPA: discoidin domain-containing protein [Planctomycetota bacterium]
MRVSEADMSAGNAVKATGSDAWLCGECAPRAAPKPPLPVRASLSTAAVPAGPRRSATATAVPARETSREKAPAKRQSTLVMGLIAGGVCLMIAGAILLANNKRNATLDQASRGEEKPLVITPRGNSVPGDSPKPAAGESSRTAGRATSPAQEREAPVRPAANNAAPAMETLSLAEREKRAEQEMQEMRNGRATRILDEAKAWAARNPKNQWQYRMKLQELIGANRSTPAAAEAERLLAALKAPAAVRGRFVRVENLGKKRILSLAEVQVYNQGKNIAPQGKASQSSTANGGDAHRAIDGNTNGTFGANSVTHTAEQDGPWWEVDLGSDKEIEGLVIWNRTECMDRLREFRVVILDATRKSIWETTCPDMPNPYVAFTPGGE